MSTDEIIGFIRLQHSGDFPVVSKFRPQVNRTDVTAACVSVAVTIVANLGVRVPIHNHAAGATRFFGQFGNGSANNNAIHIGAIETILCKEDASITHTRVSAVVLAGDPLALVKCWFVPAKLEDRYHLVLAQ